MYPEKLLFVDNTAHHLYTQQHLYKSFVAQGHHVILCCPDDGNYFRKLQDAGYACLAVKINGKSKNPVNNMGLIWKLYTVIKRIAPELIFSFTIKPNIFCAMVGRLLKIPVVPNITGLGTIFLKYNFVTQVVIKLYKFAFLDLKFVVFQNQDDSKIFLEYNILSPSTQIIHVPGSGVDLDKFSYVGYNQLANKETVFLYSGRLLWDKGIGELIEAFKLVKTIYPAICLRLIGNYFLGNPSAISKDQIELWQSELGIEYLGMVDNVYDIVAKCDCIVLPSYREGMPRSILEGSSMGKVVITTDAVGCRDTIDDGVTGFLCKVRDAHDLAEKMTQVIRMGIEQKQKMGVLGREKMVREFDQKMVIETYFNIVKYYRVSRVCPEFCA